MPIGGEEFRAALGRFASGVTVVTTKDAQGNLQGLTVSAFCSVSLEPPLISVCIHKETGSHQSFLDCKTFIVNILAECQQQLSNHFASRRPDKFAEIEYGLNNDGLPFLENCLVNLECRLAHAYDAGDHTIFVGEIKKTKVADGKPLVYFHGQYREIQ